MPRERHADVESAEPPAPNFWRHPTALVESDDVGAGTRIWAFAHVLAGARIGRDCNLGDHCFVEGGVTIGNEVVIKNGALLWTGLSVEDRAFVGPNVTFTNLLVPRAKVFPDRWGETRVGLGASIGAGATVICGVTIGRFALVGAGSVVTRDVPAFALVYGNPARRRAWVCACGEHLDFDGVSGGAACRCGRRYQKTGERVNWLNETSATDGEGGGRG